MKHRNDSFVDFIIKSIDENPDDWDYNNHLTWTHKGGSVVVLWSKGKVEIPGVCINWFQSRKIRRAFEKLAKYKIIKQLKG